MQIVHSDMSCLLRWLKQTLGAAPRSVGGGGFAEEPGLLSVDALKHTLNVGPVFWSKVGGVEGLN